MGEEAPAVPPKAARDGLGIYLARPETFTTVIYYTPSYVAVKDLYPKASVHALLLPRSPAHSRQHPLEAFDDAGFLDETRREAHKLRSLVAAELRRKVGAESQGDARRRAILDGDDDGDDEELPAGRDWEADVRVGIHLHPSMNHLHVHVVSRDMHSPAMKHGKHYNSFNTPFFIDLADLPLAHNDPRRTESFLKSRFRCWRCGRDFGNRFAQLKQHLEVEFEQWRKE